MLWKSRLAELWQIRRSRCRKAELPFALGVLLLVPFALLQGCATITQGSAQVVELTTDPPGAHCTLTRNGEVLTTVPGTPATLSVFKGKGNLQLSCRKRGFLVRTIEEGSEFEDMTLGNIIFGGIVGVFVDAGSGAMYEYPPAMHITLIPESFADAPSRDRFFDEMRERAHANKKTAAAKLRDTCEASECETAERKLELALVKNLEEIERLRTAARTENP